MSQLLRISSTLAVTRRLLAVLPAIAAGTADVCRADRCSVAVWRNRTLVPVVSRYAPGLARRNGRPRVKGLGALRLDEVAGLARACRERRRMLVVDPLQQIEASSRWRAAFGDRPFVVVPLVKRHRFLGVLALDNRETRRPLAAIRLDVARAVAGQLALALDHARLTREMRSMIQEAEALLNVGTTVSSSMDLSELARRIVRHAARAVRADSAGIYRTRERVLEPLAAYHIPKPLLEGLRREPVVSGEFPDLVQRAQWSDDVPNDPRFRHPIFSRFPVQSLLLVPLEVRSRRVGLLVCAWWTARRRIKPEEVRLMKAIAGQAAVTIEAARLATAAEQVAVDRERTRMDSLLHDTLSSTLFALALKLDTCLGADCSAELRAKLESVKAHAKTMMTQIRRLVAPPVPS